MKSSEIAINARDAFLAQRGRRVSRHEELHAQLNHQFTHDALLCAFYSNFLAYGEYDLAVPLFNWLMELAGYDSSEYASDDIEFLFYYANRQYLNTGGLDDMSKFMEQEEFSYGC